MFGTGTPPFSSGVKKKKIKEALGPKMSIFKMCIPQSSKSKSAHTWYKYKLNVLIILFLKQSFSGNHSLTHPSDVFKSLMYT